MSATKPMSKPERNRLRKVLNHPDRLVVVTVTESVAPTLTGREGCTYVSPPRPREQAMTLVRLLLGCASEPANGDGKWVAPIAGGRRTVTLVEERSR